jgi:nitroimidazol reductase NimA-like FMN-containing flavoprotein (pyridoxamine 5'-phosphate oxidase superfamily)
MLGKLTDSEMEEVLHEEKIGRIGCTDGFKPYVVPVTYVYDGKFIFARSTEGLKVQMMRKNPKVCFEVEEIRDHTNWRTVIAWGLFEEIADSIERNNAIQLFVDRTIKMKISSTAHSPETTPERERPHQPGSVNPIIYRIRILEKTGRFEKGL